MANRNQGTLHALVLVVLVITITSAVVAMYWMSRTSSKTAAEDGGNRTISYGSFGNSSLCDKSVMACDDDSRYWSNSWRSGLGLTPREVTPLVVDRKIDQTEAEDD